MHDAFILSSIFIYLPFYQSLTFRRLCFFLYFMVDLVDEFLVHRVYGKIVGGRRNFNMQSLPSISALLNRFTLPEIYHPDMVEQAKVDLILKSGEANGLLELGIKPTTLGSQIEAILLPHRAFQPDRFPDSDRLKKESHFMHQ